MLLDSLGIGESHDAAKYGDTGSNTLGHIIEVRGSLDIPHLKQKGLLHALQLSSKKNFLKKEDLAFEPAGYYGYAVEQSLGKDTPSGHWELMGVPVMFEWGYFKDEPQCFPKALIQSLIERSKIPGVLGEHHASGTTVIETYGAEHQRTGKPIIYTSADSVFQIAAHEETFGLNRLYQLCEIARELVDEYQIGRVIARPFVGEPGHYRRTGNRRDYAVLPPAPTLLDDMKAAGREVISIGKVSDIFAHQGITQAIKADGNQAIFNAMLSAFESAPDGSLVFANFVDFDSSYGHRRDVEGYAKALEAFDARLPELDKILKPGDLIVIAADHGCDPTRAGSDHTREHIPILIYGPGVLSYNIGQRKTFADVGQTLSAHLEMKPLVHGTSFLR